MSRGDRPLAADQANAIFDILVQHAGARESLREEFVYHQTQNFCAEFRFSGNLMFGGKFWRNTGYRADTTWGERWYVTAYPEDARRYPQIPPVLAATNAALEDLHASCRASATAE